MSSTAAVTYAFAIDFAFASTVIAAAMLLPLPTIDILMIANYFLK